MKKSQLRQLIKEELGNILEVNPDGTISPDEEEREEGLLYDVENRILELITYANDEADNIGGEFRGPGIRNRIKELFLKYISFRM
jgi:hypothetical protein